MSTFNLLGVLVLRHRPRLVFVYFASLPPTIHPYQSLTTSTIMDELAESAGESTPESAGEPAGEPAAQPDFDKITQSLQILATEMSLFSNLPAINDQLAQTRHEELVRLINGVDNTLHRLERRMTVR
jgi:hypothetical protein